MQTSLVRFGLIAVLVGVVSGTVIPALGQQTSSQQPVANPSTRRGTQGESSPEKEELSVPVPAETSSVTKHDWSANGTTIHYTATAGNLLIKDEKDAANGSIFYVAYTQDGVDAKNRPVTFFYNGGPGSATVWLHMGSFGPVRVVTSSRRRPVRRHLRWFQISTACWIRATWCLSMPL